jgi:hypothetical protein
MQVVHYRGEAPMIQDLISGQVDFASSNIIRSHVEAGTLRVLATTGEKRWFAFPDAPTLKELGYTAEYYAWSGFVAPAGTPQAVVDRINTSANIALADPDVIKTLTANGFEIVGGKPEVIREGDELVYHECSRDRPQEQSRDRVARTGAAPPTLIAPASAAVAKHELKSEIDMTRPFPRQDQLGGRAADRIAMDADGGEAGRDQTAHFEIAEADQRDRLLGSRAVAQQPAAAQA